MGKEELTATEYALTAYQRDIWLEQCLYPGKPIYNLGGYMEIKGEMDVPALSRSIAAVIRHNDSFRSNIAKKNGEPCLKILPELAYEVPFHDFSQQENAYEYCLDWLNREFLTPMAFGENLFQFALVKCDAGTYFWLMKVHHIIIDGMGLSIMYRQVIENYNQLLAGASELDRITYSYTDFVAEHQRYLASAAFLNDKAFWQEKYRTIPEPLFSRNAESDDAAAGVTSDRISFAVKRSLYNQIIAFSEAQGCSVFHFLLAVLFLYFSRLCGKDEVVIGVPILNRSKAKYKQTLGLFANVMPLKLQPGKDLTFIQLMLYIRNELMECYRHQKLPFGEIYRTVFNGAVEKSNIYDLSLSYINRDFSENYHTASDYQIVSLSHRHERTALTIFVRDYNEERDVVFDFDYQTALFAKFVPIENVISHFSHLLAAVLANSGESFAEIEMMPEEERRKVLRAFNNTQAGYDRDKTIHALLEDQAEQRPERPAAVFEGRQLTYRALNARANQLARVLRHKGVKPDSIVGIMTERSLEMVIGVMAVLKAGGAYLPIDPNYPADRIQYMLQDSAAAILLTGRNLMQPPDYQGEVLDLEDGRLYQGEETNLDSVNTPEDLAYIIYTSGSTGNPKGVMIAHQGIANLKTFFQQTYQVGGQDRMLQFASSSFDASVWEMFTSLLAGATLYIVSRDTIHNYGEFTRFIAANGITIALLPPPYLTGIEPGDVPGLKRLITGGSAITKGLMEKWKDRRVYINAYGPTEATVIATTWKYSPEASGYGSVPIGVPISNTQIYILDGNNRLLPVGAAGELCIAGDGLARGYLNRPELTAEKFVPNPFSPGAKMYKTGDLARWLPDGNIEFLGRIDHQVKIRGFRIELGEIEARLLEHGAVKEAVVIARQDRAGEAYLAAYFTTSRAVETGELREALLKELPEYMVPSYFIQLDKMPLTGSDKIDRKALPEPDLSLAAAVEYMAPRDETEEILARIWQEVLKVERVGLKDHFFALGGDSIKAIQVLSRLNQYGLKLEMKDLFKHPAIGELSGYVKATSRKAVQAVVEGDIGLTPIQHWLFEQSFTDKHHFNQAVMLYRREGFDEAALRSVFVRLAEHHDALRIVAKEGRLFNRGTEAGLYTLETLDLREAENFREIMAAESGRLQRSMDLYNGPLVKAKLYQARDGDHLFLVIHHLVVDGISWRILLQDLFQGYTQALSQEAITFADKTDSFKEWSERLAAYADSRELLQEVPYWAGLEAIEVKPLIKDQSVAVRSYREHNTVQVKLTEEETATLLKRANAAYHTEINDLLLTALGLAVREWTGDARILINLEGHGREEIIRGVDVSRTVGWFTAQYPVILDMSGERELACRIKSVKESLRQIPNKGIGYGILKYLTSPGYKAALQFNLQPEISFNYLGQFDGGNDGFAIEELTAGDCVSPDMESPYAIDINGMVAQGRLTLNFTYSRDEYGAATIEAVAAGFRKHLIRVAEHCAARDYSEMTPSDFTFKHLTLDALANALSGIDARNVKDVYPLSPMQEGMLYHALLDNESAAYFEQTILSVEGSLDMRHIQESFNQLVARYDILRTVFVSEKVARPLQVVLRERRADIALEDAAGLTGAAQMSFIEKYKTQDKMRGFDLRKDMPIRLSVIRTAAKSYKLIWSFHHIIMDGWCLGIILKDFLDIYASLQEGRPADLGEVYPYSGYIKWLAGQDNEAAASYWRGYVSDYEVQASLPRNNGTPEIGKYEPEEFGFTLDAAARKGLEDIARNNNVTLSTLMQALWGVMLLRYNNAEDVVFGAVVSGRPHEIEGVEKMVGLFINTLPVRIKCDGQKSFARLLQEVQQAAVDSERYSYYPLAEIQATTALKSALIDHIVAFENYPATEIRDAKSGIAIGGIEAFEQTSYDFNLVIIPGKELHIKFSYNAQVYSRSFVARLEAHMKAMIASVIGNPAAAVKDLKLLTAAEEEALLYRFNDTAAAYPKNRTIAALFAEQARKTPDNIAVAYEDQQLTYRALNEKAACVARVLRNKGVKANSIVGVMAERSPELIIGLVGILQSGGAYLPIDPAYPAERISYMLEDSGAGILLTQKHLLDKAVFPGETMDLEDPELYWGDAAGFATENTSQDLAYVIYTSGSTGNPKGVEVQHASLANLVYWHRREYDITPADRATLIAGQAFDASVWEIWPYLTAGAGLYIPDNATRSSLSGLIQWFKDNAITVSFLPTPLAEALLAEAWPGGIALRAMLTGGDKLHRRPAPDLPFALFNHYGPTENTVVATWARVFPDAPKDMLPPIGRPIDNTKVYILDRNNNLQPVGAAGELCLSGDSLARGYLNRPELTAEKFVPNPFIPGARMYRTGDLARWLPHGNIEFLGRIDHQVKIRGFRIELGEIENRILQHAAVKEAVVIAREDQRGDKYLAAYMVANPAPETDELREYLLKELPEYMVPPYFVQLDNMPLTPNGKIDRKALPEPAGRGIAGESYTAPRNDTDRRIQAVWQEILGIETIGIEDNFFMLGGNSIKAIQVVAKLALDFEIGINDIFQNQTIRTLADAVKYSKDRLKETIGALNEAAAARADSIGFDGELRNRLKEYRMKNRRYRDIDLGEREEYRNILLAGSTGYLGVHILRQLLANTDYTIYVPVRAKNDAEAEDRLWSKLKFYFNFSRADNGSLANRIRVFSGDISKESLGLSPDEYMNLAAKIDCIINSAANVKHYGHYAEFYAINVQGSQRLIEFANTGRKKAYNFISTTSVGSGYVDGEARLLFTEYDCNVGQHSDNYYVETKLAAETALAKARGEGLTANVFRVGNLVFDSASGVFQENIEDNAFYTLLKSLLNIGYFPEMHQKTMNFSFIDFVAKAIVLLFDKKNLQNETYHLFNSKQVSMVTLAELISRAGVAVNVMPVNDFIKYLYAKYEDETVKSYITRVLVHSNMFFEGASKTSFIVQNQKTESILQALNFTWPGLDREKTELMMAHCKKVGFI
ncbi:non-ribosomal peptide synthetase [Acetonema longum]|uniref:Bacitracin synthetase 1 n=1 Tax=Acetonema longum DSM 6540 TaxID=1009370 RepID=F7NDT9_9FIRM|nr:non-ribosomal peptide synthetase [Acetonema longum]EGO65810.1 bacitracin synthetase 1 [Acetonema longum DSM 6540]